MISPTLFAICTIAAAIWANTFRHRRPPLPPGPPADPIIGHLRIMPTDNQDTIFHEWSKIYGPIMHLRIPGRSIIVLNSVKVATDLLEKRSANYSDRPKFVIFEIMGWFPTLTFLGYGKRFQKHRRLLQEYLNRKKCGAYLPAQIQESRLLLKNLIAHPAAFSDSLDRFSSAIIMRITYGHNITSNNDPYVQFTTEAGHTLSKCGPPGSTPVDFMPFLQYLPRWFPGTFYAYKAKESRKITRKMHEYPFYAVKKKMAEGNVRPSFLAFHLERIANEENHSYDDDLDIQGAAGVMYVAGAETTMATMLMFFLAMVLHPECQLLAQQELDAVLGVGKLPEFSDRPSLSYVECVVQETYRWNNVVPTGIPHCSLEDDVYNGMFIPKGSIIIPNATGMSRDESVYFQPHRFNPSRFLPAPAGNGEPFPIAHFGFGRRVCPGRYLADSSVWIAISSILAAFTITKATGKDGTEIIPKLEFMSGITSQPKAFLCNIRPRSEAARQMVLQAWDIY